MGKHNSPKGSIRLRINNDRVHAAYRRLASSSDGLKDTVAPEPIHRYGTCTHCERVRDLREKISGNPDVP